MTIAFWFIYGALLFAWVIQIVVTQRWRRFAEGLEKELKQADVRHASYRAAYRDLLDDYTRLHTAYRERQ